MSSTYSYTVSPASLHDHLENRGAEPHHTDPRITNHDHSVAPVDSQQLLPPYSSHLQSNSASPTGNSNTPAESVSTVSIYQPSDFSSDFDDPFFGVNFNDPEGGTPAFLDDSTSLATDALPSWNPGYTTNVYGQSDPPSPRDPVLVDPSASAPQLTPDTNGESWSSDDSLAPVALAMASPRVMVSVWGKDGEDPVHTVERSFALGTNSQRNMLLSTDDALSVETVQGSLPSVSRDTGGDWISDPAIGQRGLAPEKRHSGETSSVNDLASARQVAEKNQEVDAWVTGAAEQTRDLSAGTSSDSSNLPVNAPAIGDDNVPGREIPLGHTTENRTVPGQVYYNADFNGGEQTGGPTGGITQNDLDVLPARNWGDAPMMYPITHIDSARNQPESSQAAIERFQRMCQDNESVISHAATWGTRRRSLPSVIDAEGILGGSIFKKLSIRGDTSSHRPSISQKLSSLVRRPSTSQMLKRKGSNPEEVAYDESDPANRRESRDSLAPPSRSSSWGIKQKQMPSLNTALVGIATGAAAIGTSHARRGSIGATSVNSPKSPFGLAPVKKTLRRPRSRTEIPKTETSMPTIIGMLKRAGGPPVAQLAKTQPTQDQDDDDDDDDDGFDDSDMKAESNKLEEIIPNFEGFQQHILRLNPTLATVNGYLVDRIAHQMVVRFKTLQNQKIKHLRVAHSGKCMSGALCIEQGGAAVPLDNRGDTRGVDPLSARPDSSDGDTTPLEGGINAESFPTGIPIPPTIMLPAEFECQLCFNSRKFVKPSDWTKHVHEDVQPFTCTWDRCRDPKMFKRKADWVRHENEGHRHLEWWTCDVEDCRHTCYRRDNFLQHLVREHKFVEPKVKTKAAVKKAGGMDPTWQKVERCHVETPSRPQDEPCKFCGKTFPTWKKLTVHLAKHMENISLPVLRLVFAKDLDEDTIISPVQDPPPRSFGSLPVPMKQEPQVYSPGRPHALSNPSPVDFSPQNPFGFHNMTHNQMQPQYYNQHQQNTQFNAMSHGNSVGGLMMPQVTRGFPPQQQYHTMPVTTTPPYGQTTNSYMPMDGQMEPFPAFNNPLGLQDPSQLSYDTLANPPVSNVEQYSNHGSVSPYSHSPNQGHHGFYNQ
ncbi:C2H2 finger domain-containing protein [Xylariales sp. AK1849]|nr:C2H2 finger domain-containing protein [Xylariales sp. AK1849]